MTTIVNFQNCSINQLFVRAGIFRLLLYLFMLLGSTGISPIDQQTTDIDFNRQRQHQYVPTFLKLNKQLSNSIRVATNIVQHYYTIFDQLWSNLIAPLGTWKQIAIFVVSIIPLPNREQSSVLGRRAIPNRARSSGLTIACWKSH